MEVYCFFVFFFWGGGGEKEKERSGKRGGSAIVVFFGGLFSFNRRSSSSLPVPLCFSLFQISNREPSPQKYLTCTIGVVSESDTRGLPSLSPPCTASVAAETRSLP